MGDTVEHDDLCKQEPCKSSLDSYQTAEKAAVAACAATQALLDKPPTTMVLSAVGAGAVSAGAALAVIFWWTGVALPVAGVLVAGGALLAGIGAKILLDWQNAVSAARVACSKAHDALDRAKDKVTADCPKECWPKWAYHVCP